MQFETKDSGQRVEFSTGMQRDVSDNKLRFDLIIPLDQAPGDSVLFRWAALMGRGAKKYGDRNWEKAATDEELQRFRESAFRHFMQWYTGQTDEDHAAAVFFNITGAEYVKGKLRRAAGDQMLELLGRPRRSLITLPRAEVEVDERTGAVTHKGASDDRDDAIAGGADDSGGGAGRSFRPGERGQP